MSVVFSLLIPIEELPPPVAFINELLPNWCERYEAEPNVRGLHTMGNTIMPICPMLEQLGEDSWQYNTSYTF